MPAQPNSGSYVTDFTRDSEIWYLPVWRDTTGAIIQNTAKGTYPKPQIEPVSIGVIKATVRKTSYTDANYKTQVNAVNDNTWRDWAAGQAWIGHVRTKEQEEGGVNYTIVRYIVYCCEYGWKSIAPQIGYYYLSGGNPKAFVDADGSPYIGCLDNSGAKLSSATDMILKEWSIKREIDFSTTLGF